ncbi:MAG: hypothetical protein KKA05_09675 [Alphaproteobacteria bacterium]|nr:hypothetical protein [Alphaproteobacteria bacterium]
MSYRAALGAQFLWQAQQAVEKYLKCILLLNRQPSGDLSHNLQKALDRINKNTDLNIILDQAERIIFRKIDNFGANRYLERSWAIHGAEIVQLDTLVWHLRQYCCTMTDIESNGKVIPVRRMTLQSIKDRHDKPRKSGHILTGNLEKILRDKKHPARSALVWQNAFYSDRTRKVIRLRGLSHGENAPLFLSPELLKYIERLVYVSKDSKAGYAQLEKEQKVLKKD